MTSYDDFQVRLSTRYSALAEERSGAPVYGIEHGLDERDVPALRAAVAGRLRELGLEGGRIAWPLLAFAAELGYSYEGLLIGYWPRLEAALGLRLGAQDRESLSAQYARAHKAVRLARPDNTAFARRFRHIAWPLVNALAPRQLHAGLAEALLEAAALDPADGALSRAVQQGCRRSGLSALVDWAADHARVDAVATALLDTPDARLSNGVVERLGRDMMAPPHLRDILTRARGKRRQQQSRASHTPSENPEPTPESSDDAGEEADLPFELSGGLQLGARTFATGLDLLLRARVPVRIYRADVEGDADRVEAGETRILDAAEPGQVVLVYSDAQGARRSGRLRFERAAQAPLLILRPDPANPTLTDLREGRLSFLLTLAPPPRDLRCTRWPTALRDVEIRLELRSAGAGTWCVRERLVGLPGRLTATGSSLAALSAALDDHEEAIGTLRAATLTIRWPSGRRVLALVDPEPDLHWQETEAGWTAYPPDLSEAYPIRSVPAADPLAAPVEGGAGAEEGARLLIVEGAGAPNFLVTGPRSMRTTPAFRPLTSHRRLRRSGDHAGLTAEVEAWLGWRCARPIHPVAAIQARAAADHARRAVLTTLCGPDWAEEEARTPPGGSFFASLAMVAVTEDLVGVAQTRAEGATIEQEDIAELRAALVRALDATAIRPRPGAAVGDEEAGILDDCILDAWSAVSEAQQARGLPPFETDIGNPADAWSEAWEHATQLHLRRPLAAAILPPRLAAALTGIDYATTEELDVARIVSDLRLDRGLLARRSRRLSGDDVLSALSLWTNPRGFAALDWHPIASGLLEDRMTARAIRYASLRIADAHGGA